MKTILSAIILFFVLPVITNAQDSEKVDSLLSLYENEKDAEQKVYLPDDLETDLNTFLNTL